jgi:creatinine amidohydrolase
MGVKKRKAPLIWNELTWTEIKEIAKKVGLVILPVGSTEQHGPHLPLNVDSLIPYKIACEVSLRTGVPVAPPIFYGASMSHKRFAGTLFVKPETLMAEVIDICKSFYIHGFKKILLLNGHVPNSWPLKAAMDNLRAEFDDIQIKVMNWWETSDRVMKELKKDKGDHASYIETSLMLALKPELVSLKKAVDEPAFDVEFDFRYDQRSKSGVWGKPSMATAKDGKRIFNMVVRDLVKWVNKALKSKIPIQ